MRVAIEYFHDESEANAFVRGVEFVGDPDMATCGPRQQEGFEDGEENAWVVAVHDNRPVGRDGEPLADPLNAAHVVFPDLDVGTDVCPLCGSKDWGEAETLNEGGGVMATLQDVLNYLVEQQAPSDLMAGVKAAHHAMQAAIPELLAYSNSGRADYGEIDYSPALRLIDAAVEGKPSAPVPASIWCDFGDGEYRKFNFGTEPERDTFADGILTAANEWGIDDFRLCFTEEQLAEAKADEAEEIVEAKRMIYRMSADASICFDVEATSEQEAVEKARRFLEGEIPADIELGGDNPLHIVAHPCLDLDKLEVVDTWEPEDAEPDVDEPYFGLDDRRVGGWKTEGDSV